jgi:hypothetical protein
MPCLENFIFRHCNPLNGKELIFRESLVGGIENG